MGDNKEEILSKLLEENKYKKGKWLGEGGEGLAYEVTKDNKKYAAKLIKFKGSIEHYEAKIIKEFRGQNLVKINFVEKRIVGNNVYYLIIMEKASFNSLKQFIDDIKNNNILNLIYNSPFEIIGDNLLRFIISQLIQGLEILNRNNFCHFDIKPENILVFSGLYVKWADFGYLRDIETIIDKKSNDNDKKIIVPGGTSGYLSPEYFQNKSKVYLNQAFKHDYFGLGATIYYIKYRKKMLEYANSGKDGKDDIMTSNQIIELIDKKMDEIKTDKSSDKDFIDLLCSLIQYKPEERPDLEKIYRNKWLDKNKEELEAITEVNDSDVVKLVVEIDKSDFLIKKKEYLEPIYKKMNEKNKNRKNKFVLKNNLRKFVL